MNAKPLYSEQVTFWRELCSGKINPYLLKILTKRLDKVVICQILIFKMNTNFVFYLMNFKTAQIKRPYVIQYS